MAWTVQLSDETRKRIEQICLSKGLKKSHDKVFVLRTMINEQLTREEKNHEVYAEWRNHGKLN